MVIYDYKKDILMNFMTFSLSASELDQYTTTD